MSVVLQFFCLVWLSLVKLNTGSSKDLLTIVVNDSSIEFEYIQYDTSYGWFVSSVTNGSIYELVAIDDLTFDINPIFSHYYLKSSVGFKIKNNKMYVCSNAPNVKDDWLNGNFSNNTLYNYTSKIIVLDLTCGIDSVSLDRIIDIDGVTLNPYGIKNNTSHYCNDLVVDNNENIYFTDSIQGCVYKVPSDSTTAEYFVCNELWVFLRSFGPTGITINEDNTFMIISVFTVGELWKITLSPFSCECNPLVSKSILKKFKGNNLTNLLFNKKEKKLFVASNGTVIYKLLTNNNWFSIKKNDKYMSKRNKYGSITSITLYQNSLYGLSGFFQSVTQKKYYIQKVKFGKDFQFAVNIPLLVLLICYISAFVCCLLGYGYRKKKLKDLRNFIKNAQQKEPIKSTASKHLVQNNNYQQVSLQEY